MVIEVFKGVIELTGDRANAAYRNYMHEAHGFDPVERWGHNLTGFRMESFFEKYPADIVIVKKNNKEYYYPKFKKV